VNNKHLACELSRPRPLLYCPYALKLHVASYPGLPAPAFVVCSTNAGEGLVKLSHMQWCTWMTHSW